MQAADDCRCRALWPEHVAQSERMYMSCDVRGAYACTGTGEGREADRGSGLDHSVLLQP